MSQTSPARIEHLRRFSDELDALASRAEAEAEAPISTSEVEAIFAEHEAECLVLEAVEREADGERKRAGRET